MFKVTVLYPASEGSTFDMEYYKTKHAELVDRILKPTRFDIDRGIDGQPYMTIGHLWYDTEEALQAGMGSPDAGETMADIPNFTNVQPQIQISQVLD